MRLYQHQPSGTVTQLRTLRREAMDAEKVLRRALREGFPSLKWRFQAPVGPFRVDFLCFAERLVIEVDGSQHAEAAEYDARRTRYIEREGYRVLRFWNNDVLQNVEGVIAQISLSLREREWSGAAMPPAWPGQRGALPTRPSREAKPSGKGEGDQRHALSPSPRAAARLAPLPQGEGK